MDAVPQDMISEATQAAETFRAIKGLLEQLQYLYDRQGGYKETLTQADLDSLPSLSDLTKQELDDGMYQLTGILLPAIETGLTQLMALAVRA